MNNNFVICIDADSENSLENFPIDESNSLSGEIDPSGDLLDGGSSSTFDISSIPEKIYSIVLDYCKETYYAASQDNSHVYAKSDLVVADTKYGLDIVRVAGILRCCPARIPLKELYCIKRMATPEELERRAENLKRVLEANKVFNEKVKANGLNMKLVTSHFLALESKMIFFFTADTRIDFRKLVKDLVEVFHLRIELRQIAARDESRIFGGIGPCGRPFCCSSITDKLPAVSGKMAKEQGLSLITQKSAGQCGRLLCCLNFEHEWYSKERQNFPPVGFKFTVNSESYTVSDINIVSGNITVVDSQSRTFQVGKNAFVMNKGHWTIDRQAFNSFYEKS